jgi:hypothetical protein
MIRPPSPDPLDGTGGIACVIHRSRVEWADTDAAGHHHNTAIVRFVEAAEAAEAFLVTRRGLSGYFGAAPRLRYEADFTAPLWFGQDVTTTLVVENIGTSSMTDQSGEARHPSFKGSWPPWDLSDLGPDGARTKVESATERRELRHV